MQSAAECLAAYHMALTPLEKRLVPGRASRRKKACALYPSPPCHLARHAGWDSVPQIKNTPILQPLQICEQIPILHPHSARCAWDLSIHWLMVVTKEHPKTINHHQPCNMLPVLHALQARSACLRWELHPRRNGSIRGRGGCRGGGRGRRCCGGRLGWIFLLGWL